MIISCKKIDLSPSNETSAPSEENFFERSQATSPQVVRVMAEFSKRNKGSKLVPRFFKQYGQPLWDIGFALAASNTLSGKGESEGADTVVIIPVIQQNINEVQTYIEAHLSDSVQLIMHTGAEYKTLRFSNSDTLTNEAETLAIRFMLLNKDVFNHESFTITDKRLFHHSSNYADTANLIRKTVLKTSNTEARFSTICVEINTKTYHCPYAYCNGENGTCDGCSLCTTTTTTLECETWWDDDGGGGSTGGGGSSGGGGGGGGDTGGDDTDPCTGSGAINKTDLPCDEGGGDGWNPESHDNDPPEDPCPAAQNAAKKLDTIFNLSKADSVLASIPNLATEPLEKGFGIIKKLTINPYDVKDTTIGYRSSAISTGTDSSIEILFQMAPRLEYAVATLHTHPPTKYPAHSAGDIYQLLTIMLDKEEDYQGTFVAAANGSQYALSITDAARASAFLITQDQNLSGTEWNKYSDIGKEFKEAKNYFLGGDTTQSKKYFAYEMAMAAVLNQFGTGLVLNKKDAAGNFKPIIVAKKPDPKKPKRNIYIQDCQ